MLEKIPRRIVIESFGNGWTVEVSYSTHGYAFTATVETKRVFLDTAKMVEYLQSKVNGKDGAR